MARTLSDAFRSAYAGEDSAGLVSVMLLVFEHANLASPLRFCLNHETVEGIQIEAAEPRPTGITYTPTFFEVAFPPEQENAPPSANLIIDNFDQAFITIIRSMIEPAKVTMGLASRTGTSPGGVPEFDSLEQVLLALQWSVVEWNEQQVSGRLEPPRSLNHGFPRLSFTPSVSPALFWKGTPS